MKFSAMLVATPCLPSAHMLRHLVSVACPTFVALLLLAACREPAAMVEDTPPVEPELLRTLAPPGSELVQPTLAFLLHDQGTFVFDEAEQRYYIFDAAGALRTSGGGRGESPGQFLGVLSAFEIAPDTIAIWDGPSGRLTLVAASGALVSSNRASGWQGDNSLLIIGATDRETLVGIRTHPSRPASRGIETSDQRVSLLAGRLAETPRVLRDLAAIRGIEYANDGVMTRIAAPQFTPRSIAVCHSAIVIASDTTIEVQRLDGSIGTHQTLRGRGAPFTPPELERDIGELVSSISPAALRGDVERALIARSGSPTVRLTSPIFSSEGGLWHSSRQFSHTRQHLTLDGTRDVSVQLPTMRRLVHTHDTLMVAIRTPTDTSFAQVEMYRIPRLSSGASAQKLERCGSTQSY